MNKRHGFLTLVLLCASSAFADTAVNPVLNQDVDLIARRYPEMYEVCKNHLEIWANRDKIVEQIGNNEGCQKVASLLMAAVKQGFDACTFSFDPTVRDVMEQSFESNFKRNQAAAPQGLFCTFDDAVASPCEICRKSISDIVRVVTVGTTQEIEQSSAIYKNLLPQLQNAAQQFSCDKFKNNAGQMKEIIAALNSDLKNAQIQAVRFTKASSIQSSRESIQVSLQPPQRLGVGAGEARYADKDRADLPPVRVGTGTDGGESDAGRASVAKPAETASQEQTPAASQVAQNQASPSKAKAKVNPQAQALNTTRVKPASTSTGTGKKRPSSFVDAGQLSNGGTGFAYSDPSDPSKNYIGYQIKDPKTGKMVSYAYPTSRENVVAVAKDPSLCDQLIKDAQSRPTSNKNAEQDARDRGQALFASFEKHGKPGQGSSSAATAQNTGSSSKPVADTNSGADPAVASSTNDGASSSDVALPKKDLGSGLQARPSQSGLRDSSPFSPLPQSSNTNPDRNLGSGLKDNSRVGVQDESNYGLKGAQDPGSSLPTSESAQDLGRGVASSQGPLPTSQSTSQPTVTAKEGDKNQKPSKPKPQPRKAVASSQKNNTNSKPAAESKKSEDKPAEYSGMTFTSEGVGRVRYFLVNLPPRIPYVGRVIEVKGKTQILYYDLPSADSKQLKDMGKDANKIKAAFEERNSSQANHSQPLLMDIGVDNRAIEKVLLNQVPNLPNR